MRPGRLLLACLLLLAAPAQAEDTMLDSVTGWFGGLFESAPERPETPPPAPADWAGFAEAVEANASAYAELHATLKPCSPARDLRDRYLDWVEANLPAYLGTASQAYDIAYLSAPRGVSNCAPAGQQQVEAGMQARIAELAALAGEHDVATASPDPPDPDRLPAWARTRVLFTTYLFADQHAELAACDAAEADLRQGYLGWIEANVPAVLEVATERYDATLTGDTPHGRDCSADAVAAGQRHLELTFRDLQRVGDTLAQRRASPPSWTERLMETYGTCEADGGRRDVDCYCQGEAAANRAKLDPAAVTRELDAPAAVRCAQPQAVRVTQYDACIQVYGAFVTGDRRARAERYCACVASHVVRHFREQSLPDLRQDGIEACQSVS